MTNNIRERLDRVVVNPKLWDQCPNYAASHLPHGFSNHYPIRVEMESKEQGFGQRKKFPFRFNADWILKEDFETQVNEGWSREAMDLPEKLESLGIFLMEWSNTCRKRRQKRKKDLNEKIDNLKSDEPNDDNLEEFIEIKLAHQNGS